MIKKSEFRKMWKLSHVLLIFLLIAFIIAVILALTFITKKENQITELDRLNLNRAHVLLPIAFVLGLLVLIYQKMEMSGAKMFPFGY